MDDEEGYTHGDDHGYQYDTLQYAEDKSKGAYQFGKYGEHERIAATYAERVGKERIDGMV